MTTTHSRVLSRLAVVLAAILLASSAATAATSPALTADIDRTAEAPALEAGVPDNNTTTTTTTSSGPPDNDSSSTGPPDMASQARITPSVPNEDYVDISVHESDAVFNTTGGFATFTVSERVAAARIPQQQASVDVLANGYMIRVQYQDDASTPGSASLYNLELFFEDNSTKTVDLYARKTAVSASTSINPEWQGLIKHVRENADSAGYNATPSGGLEYVEQQEDRAELFSGLLTEDFKKYPVLLLANFTNIPMVLSLLFILTVVALIWKRKFGWILSRQQVSTSISSLMRTHGKQEYEKSRQAAAQHNLSDVDEIGTNAARYWRSEMNAETIDDMVELACKGIVETDEQGRVVTDDHGNDQFITNGIADLLDVEPVTGRKLREETWLKPILVQNRMRAETVLANIERALQVAEKQYRRGNQVRETRLQVQELLGDLKDVDTGTETASISPHADGRRVPTGGD